MSKLEMDAEVRGVLLLGGYLDEVPASLHA